MAFNINVGGQPKKVKDMYVNVGGGVKKIVSGWVNDGTATPRKVFGNGGGDDGIDRMIIGGADMAYSNQTTEFYYKGITSFDMVSFMNLPPSTEVGGNGFTYNSLLGDAVYSKKLKKFFTCSIHGMKAASTSNIKINKTKDFKTWEGSATIQAEQIGDSPLAEFYEANGCLYLYYQPSGSRFLAYSIDGGNSWTKWNNGATSGMPRKIVYFDGKYYGTNGSKLMESENGYEFSILSNITFPIDSIATDENVMLVGGGGTSYLGSRNHYYINKGVDKNNTSNWVRSNILESSLGLIYHQKDLFYSNGRFLVPVPSGTSKVNDIYETNDVSGIWNKKTINVVNKPGSIKNINFYNGKYYALVRWESSNDIIGNIGQSSNGLFASNDLINWSRATNGIFNDTRKDYTRCFAIKGDS